MFGMQQTILRGSKGLMEVLCAVTRVWLPGQCYDLAIGLL